MSMPMETYGLVNGKLRTKAGGSYLKLVDVLDMLEGIEYIQQTYNGHRTCPMCDQYPHAKHCDLGDFLVKHKRSESNESGD